MSSRTSVPRIAGPPATLMMALLFLTASRYGFHGDELYFRMLPLGWWYEDQPPLSVWLAHGAASVSDAVWVQRLPAILAAGAGVIVASLFPRIAGYGSRVRRTAAWAHGFTVYPLLMGHVMLTASLDLLAWQLVILGVVAALTGHRYGLTWAGIAAGLACWNKLLVLVLVAALFIALLICARWVLKSSDAAHGAIAVVALGGFQVAAQLSHGGPMLAVSRDLASRFGTTNRLLILPLLVIFLGPPFIRVWWRGLCWRPLVAQRRTGPVLLIAGVVLIGFSLISPSQPYYAVALFLPALALGWGPASKASDPIWQRAPLVIGLNALVAVVLCLPLVPANSVAFAVSSRLNPMARDQVGWPGYVHEMVAARKDGVILTDTYALAGAVKQVAPSIPVSSGNNALWSEGPPSTSNVLLVGRTYAKKRRLFARCEDAGRLHTADNPFGISGTPMFRCSSPQGGWRTVWPQLRRLGG